MRPTPGTPGPAHAGCRSSCACRRRSSTDIPEHWPASESCAQHFQHCSQRPAVHPVTDAQPFTARQYQFQARLLGRFRTCPSGLDQGEPHRLLSIVEPFAPTVEAMLRQPMFFAELPYRDSPALLLGDPLPPLICFACPLILHDGSRPETPMPAPQSFGKRGSSDAYLNSKRLSAGAGPVKM